VPGHAVTITHILTFWELLSGTKPTRTKSLFASKHNFDNRETHENHDSENVDRTSDSQEDRKDQLGFEQNENRKKIQNSEVCDGVSTRVKTTFDRSHMGGSIALQNPIEHADDSGNEEDNRDECKNLRNHDGYKSWKNGEDFGEQL